MQAVLNGDVNPTWIRDRIILIGSSAASIPDYSKIPATSVINTTDTWVYGLEVQGHAVSQILSAVLDDRPFIRSWPESWDYIWILGWGIAGLSLAASPYSPYQNLGRWLGLSLGLGGICYLLFLAGLWIPVVPTFLVLTLNSLVVKSCYEYQRKNQVIVAAKQLEIEMLESAKAQLENRVLERTLELEVANKKLEELANLDGLTHIANRRYFDQYLTIQWAEKQTQKQALTIVLIDIDYFKRYNDRYGHQSGDDCLYRVAQAIFNALSVPDSLVARYGGEEFVIILPDTNETESLEITKAIQTSIRSLKIPHKLSDVSDYITLSMGISSAIPNAKLKKEDLV
jgi:diguanylate cyclase (GGDEF)-like protein